MTFKVEILNPKAKKLLLEMQAKKLIALSKVDEGKFIKLVRSIRKNALKYPISKDEITREVELVRGERYARKKRQGNI